LLVWVCAMKLQQRVMHESVAILGTIISMRCKIYFDGKITEYLVKWDRAPRMPVWYTSEELTDA
jgi:hypothetical protein